MADFDRDLRRPLLLDLSRRSRVDAMRRQAASEPEDTRLSFMLPSIRQDAEDLVTDCGDEPCRPWDSCAGHDSLRMLGAIEELLALGDPAVTEVITRHLTGEGETEVGR